MNMVVEVLPDVSGIDRTFAYDVPQALAGSVKVGCIVRVVLHGRRVRGWVVAEASVVPPDVELRPVSEVVSLGPPQSVVELSRWASWRYSGRLRPLLLAASPPRLVRALPPASEPWAGSSGRTAGPAGDIEPGRGLEREIAAATFQALSSRSAVLRLPPAAPRLAAVEATIEATAGVPGDVLVLAASRTDAVTLTTRLERSGHALALQPDAWSEAASGGRVVVGTRSAVLSPVVDLRAVVVLDAHSDSYQEERVPTWEAAVLNRKGRARLLACVRCGSLLRCEACGTALVQLERPAQGELALLHCPRCSSSGPVCCASCGPTRSRIVRPGVARARDDLAALTGLEVAEIGRTSTGPGVSLPDAPVLIGTEAVLHRAVSASVVVFLDFDQELLAPRYRAGEQALALLALASRVVGGRRREGRVVVRTRLPDHEVLAAALHADPGRLVSAEGPRRALLRLPPTTALALVSGDGADEFVTRLACSDPPVEVGSLAAGRFLVRAAGSEALADALASAGQPAQGTRIEVDPRHV
jgi:primosomal protein N' (replication factor Y)